MSWAIGQAAWAWAKTGIWEFDYVEAYAYANDEEVHDDDHESEEKPSVDPKDEKSFELINRTRLEVCDQEVNVYLVQLYIIVCPHYKY